MEIFTTEKIITCTTCEAWLRPCFPCRWRHWKTEHGLHVGQCNPPPPCLSGAETKKCLPLPSSYKPPNNDHDESFSCSSSTWSIESNDISVMLTQISGLEFLFHNLRSIGNDRRRSYLFWNNQALAEAIMMFGDHIYDSYENPALALEIYLDALTFKSTYIPLIARVLSFLLIVNRHTEVLSLAISLIEWPTLRFTPDIWLQCCNSLWDEIPAQMSDYALVVPVSLAILKSRLIAQLQEDQTALDAFLLTDCGIVLDPLRCVLSEYLGGCLISNQIGELQTILYYLSRQVPSLCSSLIVEHQNTDEHRTDHVHEFELTGIFDSHSRPRVWNALLTALSSNGNDVHQILQINYSKAKGNVN
jgi:hypothetical protein